MTQSKFSADIMARSCEERVQNKAFFRMRTRESDSHVKTIILVEAVNSTLDVETQSDSPSYLQGEFLRAL
jgi:hypothetical protein